MKKQGILAICLIMMMLTPALGFAQNNDVIKEEKIKVNFHCANGKTLIEKELVKETGVKEVVADLETKIVTIKYVDGKTNRDKLVAAIEKIGYTTEFTKDPSGIKKACSHDNPEQH